MLVDQTAESHLIAQAQAGDRQAFTILVDRYWPRVCNWLYHLTGNGHAAEDLTQDVFLKVWGALGAYRGNGFRTWLFRIASNAWIDSCRGQRAIPAVPLPTNLAEPSPGPMAMVLGQESQTRIEAACARLPAKLRGPLLLRTQEDMSFAEIAQVYGITEETVRWRVFKARQLLLHELKLYLDGKSA